MFRPHPHNIQSRNIVQTFKQTVWAVAVLAVFAWVGNGCNQTQQYAGYQDSVRVLKLYADASFGTLVQELKQAYEARYPKARIELTLASEAEVIAQFQEGKADQVLLARSFPAEEIEVLKAQEIYLNWWYIADEAIAVVLHPDNPDSILSLQQLEDIFTGKTTTWQQLDPHPLLKDKPKAVWAGTNDAIVLAFDSKQPGVMNYLADSVFNGQKPGKGKFFGQDDAKALLAYVAETPGAVGLLNAHFLYYADAPTAGLPVQKVRVAKVSKKPDSPAVKPIPQFVWEGAYPLVRKVFLLSRTTEVNLGAGFAKYAMDTNTGQKLINNIGMAPAEGLTRLVRYESKAVDLETGNPK